MPPSYSNVCRQVSHRPTSQIGGWPDRQSPYDSPIVSRCLLPSGMLRHCGAAKKKYASAAMAAGIDWASSLSGTAGNIDGYSTAPWSTHRRQACPSCIPISLFTHRRRYDIVRFEPRESLNASVSLDAASLSDIVLANVAFAFVFATKCGICRHETEQLCSLTSPFFATRCFSLRNSVHRGPREN